MRSFIWYLVWPNCRLQILKLHDLYYYNIALLCYNYHKVEGFPKKLEQYFTTKTEINDRTTRSNELDLYYKPPRLNSTYRKPSLCGSAFWNTLPDDIKNIGSINSFKQKLKSYFINQYWSKITKLITSLSATRTNCFMFSTYTSYPVDTLPGYE